MRIRKFFLIPILLTIILLCVSSCSKDEDVESPTELENATAVMLYDTNHETDYPVSIVNAAEKTAMFFKTDAAGNVTAIDQMFFEKDKSPVMVTFNDDGLLSAIGTKDATITFANYKGKSVDVAVVVDGKVAVTRGYEAPNEWSEMPRMKFDLSGFGSRAASDEDLVNDAFKFVSKQFTSLGSVVIGALKNKNMVLATATYVMNVITSGTRYVAGLKGVDFSYSSFLVYLGLAALNSSPWGVLFTLIGEFDTYTDLVSDIVLDILKMKDDFMKDTQIGHESLIISGGSSGGIGLLPGIK